jgi:hypothetical protein
MSSPNVNLSKTTAHMNSKKSVPTSQRTQSLSFRKTSRFIWYIEIIGGVIVLLDVKQGHDNPQTYNIQFCDNNTKWH